MHGTRTGFEVIDVLTGKKALLAGLHNDGPKVSKYHVDIKSFESFALPALSSFKNYDVLIVDEISWMELKSQKFANLLDDVFDSDTPVLAAIHSDYVEKYGAEGVKISVKGRQDAAYEEVMKRLETMLGLGGEVEVRKKTSASVKPSAPISYRKEKEKKAETKSVTRETTETRRDYEKSEPRNKGKKETGFFAKLKKFIGI